MQTNMMLVACIAVALIAATGCASSPTSEAVTRLEHGMPAERIDAAGDLAMAKDPVARDALVSALSDPEPLVRHHAVYGLERLHDVDSVPAIIPLVKDEDRWVRDCAVVALGKLGDESAVPTLADVATGDETELAVQAVIALGRIGGREANAAIVRAMGNPRMWSEPGAWSQASVLAQVEREDFTDRDVIPVLKALVEHGGTVPGAEEMVATRSAALSLLIRHRAARALLKFGDTSGEDVFLEGMKGDDYMRQDSAIALGEIGSKQAVPLLIEETDDEWMANRRYAVIALGKIGDARAVPKLEELLEDPDVGIRRLASEALVKVDGKRREVDLTEPAAEIPDMPEGELSAPGGKRPPQFICLGVDDCANIEGLETMLDIAETLHERGSKAVFTMWVAPLAGDYENRDVAKQTLILQRLFDLGSEIAHHTLHHNPGGRNWSSLPPEGQIEEIEGCTQWFRDNIEGFTRCFTHKHGGGGSGQRYDPEFTRELLAKQNFIYRGRRGGHPNEQSWAEPGAEYFRIETGIMDGNAPPVHARITHGIRSDYAGSFDYEVPEGVAMWKANLDYHYRHPLRPILGVNAFHDWGMKYNDGGGTRHSHRNEGEILKQFLLDVLVENRDEYPDNYCVTYRQVVEYVNTEGDLEQTLAIGNGQDSRNPVKPSIE